VRRTRCGIILQQRQDLARFDLNSVGGHDIAGVRAVVQPNAKTRIRAIALDEPLDLGNQASLVGGKVSQERPRFIGDLSLSPRSTIGYRGQATIRGQAYVRDSCRQRLTHL
jgi:hypothetical protein